MRRRREGDHAHLQPAILIAASILLIYLDDFGDAFRYGQGLVDQRYFSAPRDVLSTARRMLRASRSSFGRQNLRSSKPRLKRRTHQEEPENPSKIPRSTPRRKSLFLEMSPKTDEDAEMLQDLLEERSVDVFNPSAEAGVPTVALVSTEQAENLTSTLTLRGVPHTLTNATRLVDRERKDIEMQNRASLNRNLMTGGTASLEFYGMNVYNYNPWATIRKAFTQAAKNNDHRLEWKSYGTTAEGRELMVLIFKTKNDDNKKKAKVWLDCGMHAREWISVATCVYIAYRLIATPEGEVLLRHFDFLLMPVVNPDGYDFSWTEDRFWQKNRNPNLGRRNRSRRRRRRRRRKRFSHNKQFFLDEEDDECFGVDLNRNFPVGFGGIATSDQPCSNIYRGTAPFSEPESKAIKKAIEEEELNGKFAAFLTFHSYGQYIFVPKTHREGNTETFERDIAVANNFREKIHQSSGQNYKVSSEPVVWHAYGGASTDWAYETKKIPLALKFELPPSEDDGVSHTYSLPVSDIRPTVEAVWAAMEGMPKFLLNKSDEGTENFKSGRQEDDNSIFNQDQQHIVEVARISPDEFTVNEPFFQESPDFPPNDFPGNDFPPYDVWELADEEGVGRRIEGASPPTQDRREERAIDLPPVPSIEVPRLLPSPISRNQQNSGTKSVSSLVMKRPRGERQFGNLDVGNGFGVREDLAHNQEGLRMPPIALRVVDALGAMIGVVPVTLEGGRPGVGYLPVVPIGRRVSSTTGPLTPVISRPISSSLASAPLRDYTPAHDPYDIYRIGQERIAKGRAGNKRDEDEDEGNDYQTSDEDEDESEDVSSYEPRKFVRKVKKRVRKARSSNGMKFGGFKFGRGTRKLRKVKKIKKRLVRRNEVGFGQSEIVRMPVRDRR